MSDHKVTTHHVERTTGDEQLRAPQAAEDLVLVEDDNDVEKEPVETVPKPEDQLDALGIPNWRELEKKLVRRLDPTLMPCLWCLYLFNYLDRASIAQARLSTLEEDLGLTGSQFSTAVSILSYG